MASSSGSERAPSHFHVSGHGLRSSGVSVSAARQYASGAAKRRDRSPTFELQYPVSLAGTESALIPRMTRKRAVEVEEEPRTMNDKEQRTEAERPSDEPEDGKTKDSAVEAEFELKIRKLELPVRPRGVLAE
jgi:hypothetical protein